MTETPLLDSLLRRLAGDNPLQQRSLDAGRENLHSGEALDLEAYLSTCAYHGYGEDAMAKAYQTITLDTLREQVYFQRNGRYRHSTFAEVAGRVYFDHDYMQRYMYGLALTLYLWPNHLEIVRYFKRMLPRISGGRYLEVGPGHGTFFRHAIRHGEFAQCLGVDISPTSLELTRRLLSNDPTPTGTRWDLMEADFLAAEGVDGHFDAIVMGEVLEHVEQPLRFLQRIRELAGADAFIFVTTAVNAPAIDHIYLFESLETVTRLAEAAGMTVRNVLATPYHGSTMEETVAQRLPINVALVLSR